MGLYVSTYIILVGEEVLAKYEVFLSRCLKCDRDSK